MAIVGIGVALFLLRQNAAERQDNREAFAVRLAAQAVREVTERPDLGLRLATLAFAESDLPATRSALVTTLTQPAQLRELWAPEINGTPSAATIVAGTDRLIIGTARRRPVGLRTGRPLVRTASTRQCDLLRDCGPEHHVRRHRRHRSRTARS